MKIDRSELPVKQMPEKKRIAGLLDSENLPEDTLAKAARAEDAIQISRQARDLQVQLEAAELEKQGLEVRAARARGRPHEIGLCHAFPCSRPGRRLPGTVGAPKTVVWVRLEPSGLAVNVETAHSYPNEETIVFSSTRVSLEVRAEVQP